MIADWVIGRGLLGNAIARQLAPEPFRRPIEWTDASRSIAELDAARGEFLADGADQYRIFWCAGSGVTSTSADILRVEHEVFAAFLAGFTDVPDEIRERITFFLASSVGGAYAGNPAPPYTEESATASLSAYGETKLAMEETLTRAVERLGARGFIGRITNLYGPGQKLGKRQGLITVFCETYFTRQPASVYVSLDTLRDYIFEDDCAAVVVAGASRAAMLPRGEVRAKIIGTGNAVSIGELVGTITRVRRRRPLVAFGGGSARGQAPDLRVESKVWPDLQRFVITTLPAGIDATYRAIQHARMRGDLSS